MDVPASPAALLVTSASTANIRDMVMASVDGYAAKWNWRNIAAYGASSKALDVDILRIGAATVPGLTDSQSALN